MSKKSILAAVFLIFIGIIFGVVLVSNFRLGVEQGFAGDPQAKLGAPSQIKDPNYDYKALSKSFIEVSKAVSPTVVAVVVTSKAKSRSSDINEFFHFFSPDGKMPQPEPQQGAGSGVIISQDGYILTNNHVVEDADAGIEVILNNKHRAKAKIIGTDPSTDLAVIRVEGSDLPTAAFGNSDKLEIGEWVLAIGNPLGLQGTVTAGIVSAIGRRIGLIQDSKGYGIENFIQTDAAINPGNSGGPLVNMNGEVVGINSAIATTNARYQGYGFAIPINLARAVAEDIIKSGKVRRGFIGVNITTVDETMAKAIGLEKAGGVQVQTLEKGGAAEAAGIKEMDVILTVDDQDVNEPNQLQSYVARKHPGDDVTLKIFRDGKVFEKKVTLRARKEENLVASNKDDNQPESSESEVESSSKAVAYDNLGLSVKKMTSQERKEADVDKGIIVAESKTYSEAFNHGVQTGDIILEADRKEIYSPKDFDSIIKSHKPGDAILLRVKQKGTVVFLAIQIPK